MKTKITNNNFEILLAHFIEENALTRFLVPAMQTYGIITAMAAAPFQQNPSDWLPLLWGGENAPFENTDQLEEYAGIIVTMWNTQRQALLRNQWQWPSDCALCPTTIVNQAARDFCDGLLQGWSISQDDWQLIMPKEEPSSHLLDGVLLSISILAEPEEALVNMQDQGVTELANFVEIYEAMPMMLAGISMRAAELSEPAKAEKSATEINA